MNFLLREASYFAGKYKAASTWCIAINPFRRKDKETLSPAIFSKGSGHMEEKAIGARLKEDHTEAAPLSLREESKQQRSVMTIYERFEHVVALILSMVIAVIVVVALLQLIRVVFILLVTQSLNPLEHEIFQLVFGMIMTLLIALEFKHSIIRVAFRHESIIQVKTVVLIALIALSRKFVILDPDTSPSKVAALAGALLALGIVYWLMRERDDCEAKREHERKALEAERKLDVDKTRPPVV
jgi:uncharacterized membrane protein (DUF373 family)